MDEQANAKLTFAVVGVGMIGKRHLQALRDVERCCVKAVVDVNVEVVKLVAREFGIPEAYTDYKRVLDDAQIDAILIATPPFAHAPIAMDALSAGKHVLCEKPMAITPAQADDMVTAARRANRILACCSARPRLGNVFKTAREIVQSGALGDIYCVSIIGLNSRRVRPGIEYNPSAVWFLDKSKAGGGALMDWGIYDMSVLFGLFDDLAVERASGWTFRGIDEPDIGDAVFDVEEHGGAILHCSDGMSVIWQRAWAVHMKPEARWQIFGSRGGITFNPYQRDASTIELYVDEYGKQVTTLIDVPPMRRDAGAMLIEDFATAVIDNRSPSVTGDESAQMIRVIHAVYESHMQRREVTICGSKP